MRAPRSPGPCATPLAGGAALTVELAAGEPAAKEWPAAAPQYNVTINAASADLRIFILKCHLANRQYIGGSRIRRKSRAPVNLRQSRCIRSLNKETCRRGFFE